MRRVRGRERGYHGRLLDEVSVGLACLCMAWLDVRGMGVVVMSGGTTAGWA